MIEFKKVNHDEEVMEYLKEWNSDKTGASYYHLYVDGVKKDDTLYAFCMFDKVYFADEHQTISLTYENMPQLKTLYNGYILCHKWVEGYYSESVLSACHSHDPKHLFTRPVLISANGVLLWEYDEKKYDLSIYPKIINENLFAVVDDDKTTSYYKIDLNSSALIYKGFEEISSEKYIYGYPITMVVYGSGDYVKQYPQKNKGVVYRINKKTLEVETDNEFMPFGDKPPIEFLCSNIID